MSDITNNSDVCQWYLIVDHEQIPIGEATSLTVPGTLTVGGLKTRIKEKEQNDLAQVDTRTLTIFGCKDSSINLFSDDEDAGDEGTVLNKLKKVFSNHWQMVEKLDVERTVESLQLLNETLVIQVPDVQRKRDDGDRSGYHRLKRALDPAMTPASPTQFYRITRPWKVIDCDCPYDPYMLPIELYDNSFGVFKTRCCNPPSTYTRSLLEGLTVAACDWRELVIFRQQALQGVLKSTDFLFDVEVGAGCKWTTDGHLDVNVMPAAIRECGLNQVISYYSKFVLEALESLRGYGNLSTHFPCVLMVDQGPRMGFYGAVWDGRARVEPLMTLDLTFHHQYEKDRFAIPSCLDAFKETIDCIQAHYKWVRDQVGHTTDAF